MEPSKRFGFLMAQVLGFLFWLTAAILCIGTFIHLTWSSGQTLALRSLDQGLLTLAAGYHWDTFNPVAADLAALGSPTLISLFTLLGLLLMRLKRDQWGAFYLMVSSIGAGVLCLVGRLFLSHSHTSFTLRMAEGSGSAHPSEICILSSSVYLVFAYLVCAGFPNYGARVLVFLSAFLLIAVICLSPLYLGIAYPSDVISGMLLGLSWGFLVIAVVSGWKASRAFDSGPLMQHTNEA